ncbi:low molecular weight phosphatase family protein [Pontivivens ytuae]|uniref:Low molecular weight phosphatase family protein n=1 Tax=Pontivivens ytuae TaxID=2789856 RepID=A0A7S9LQL1_9RHOB|nr:low molecular weight phosphatase family protein [Pontivivens ytuae]QPH53299.1 low molecular weight phosphatase family protein [Pontivivens ytuae]
MTELPTSVLFCCDHNAVRSPMAEGLMKQRFGRRVYVQSAGVRHEQEIDGFAIAVCKELGVELARHRSRSFEEMAEWGDDLGAFDMIVALSPASLRHAHELTRTTHVDVLHWPIMDPTGLGEGREEKLGHYRAARDQIAGRIADTFG